MNTTDQAQITEPAPTDAVPPAPKIAPARALAWPLGAIAAGWLISGLATVAHVDLILLPLLVVAVSSVLRAGRNVVDRLMLSTFLVAGALVVAGLLFSLWPWGLMPFPVAGFLFTTVAIVAWLSKRRPRLPRGFAFSDLVILGTGVFVFLAEVRPLRRTDRLDWFTFTATSEDRAAHFALFDTIHRLGSYPFLDQAAARVSLQSPAEASYPTGSHFIFAIIDIFARSTTDPGPAIAEFNRYFFLVLAAFAFLVMSIVWAARWILVPLVNGWRLFAAVSTISAILLGGPLMLLVNAAFDSQIVGITVVALTVAIAIRPPASLEERIVLFGAGIILITYSYFLYLPLVAIAAVASLWVDRRFLRHAWRPIVASAAVVAAISVIPLYFAFTSTLDWNAQTIADGATIQIPHSTIIAVTIASLAVLVTPTGGRFRRTKVIRLLISALAAMIVLFGIYQVARLGRTSYYFDKLLVGYLVIGIICSATLVMFLNPLTTRDRGSRRTRLREVSLGIVAAALAFTMIAGFGIIPGISKTLAGEWATTSLGKWYSVMQPHTVATDASDDLRIIAKQGMLADGTPTLFLVSNLAYENWRVTFYGAALNRINGAIQDSVNSVIKMPTGGTPMKQESLDQALGELEQTLAHSKVPLRIVVRDRATADAIAEALAARPDLHATVVLLTGS
jgi:hypothetical protein